MNPILTTTFYMWLWVHEHRIALAEQMGLVCTLTTIQKPLGWKWLYQSCGHYLHVNRIILPYLAELQVTMLPKVLTTMTIVCLKTASCMCAFGTVWWSAATVILFAAVGLCCREKWVLFMTMIKQQHTLVGYKIFLEQCNMNITTRTCAKRYFKTVIRWGDHGHCEHSQWARGYAFAWGTGTSV